MVGVCLVWWRMLGFGMGGRVVLGGWLDILSACGFEGWMGALCGCGFENWCVGFSGSDGISLCGSVRR